MSIWSNSTYSPDDPNLRRGLSSANETCGKARYNTIRDRNTPNHEIILNFMRAPFKFLMDYEWIG
jgi:hypothetical protein